MTTIRRLSVVLGALVLAVATGFTPAHADAPQVALTTTVTGGAPEITVRVALTVTGNALDAAQLTIAAPETVPAEVTTFTVDGTPAPGGTVSVTTAGATVNLGTGATGSTGGTLAPGTYTIAYRADALDVQPGDQIGATASGTVGGAPASVTATPVAVPLPDLQVATPRDSGESATLPLGTGVTALFGAYVSNLGTAVGAADLVVTLPAGLRVDPSEGVRRFAGEDDDTGVRLPCTTSGRTVTCRLGALGTNRLLVGVPVQATTAAPIGKVGRFVIAAVATSTTGEANPKDNSVTGSVRFVGKSRLTLTLHAPTTRVKIGSTVAIKISVHNGGPQPAASALAIIEVLDSLDSFTATHFAITHFTGRLASGLFDISGISGRTATPTAATLPFLPWDIGTIRVGGTATSTLTLKARSAGHGLVLATAVSAQSDPATTLNCTLGGGTRCPGTGVLRLTAIRAAKHHASPSHPSSGSSTHTTSSGATGQVANTGSPTAELTTFGLLAVVAGAALMWLTAMPRRGRHRVV